MIDSSNKLLVDGDYQFPQWTLDVGWTILTICIIAMPFYYLYQYIRSFQYVRTHPIASDIKVPDYIRAFRRTNAPVDDWGPKELEDRTGPYATPSLPKDGVTNDAFDPYMYKP